MSVSAAQMRDECAFMLQRMATPQSAHETSRKAQFNKIARMTGLGVRRVEKLFRGYVTKPLAHERATIGNAFRKWLHEAKAEALRELEQLEAEHAGLAGTAADYVFARWQRAVAAGARFEPLGQVEVAAAHTTGRASPED